MFKTLVYTSAMQWTKLKQYNSIIIVKMKDMEKQY